MDMAELTYWQPALPTTKMRQSLYKCGFKPALVRKMTFAQADEALKLAIAVFNSHKDQQSAETNKQG